MTSTPPTADTGAAAETAEGTSASRRSAQKLAAVGIGSVAAVGVGVGGVRAATDGAFSAGSDDPYDLWHPWTTRSGIDRMVAAGILACNPHNTQAWRIAVKGDAIHVHSDPGRRMPLNDASAREHFAGLGCAIENMVIATGSAGRTAKVILFPNGTASGHVALIALRDDGFRVKATRNVHTAGASGPAAARRRSERSGG